MSTSHTASAYKLAKANIRKPWARRWMNQHGHRWAAGIYRERQKRNKSDEQSGEPDDRARLELDLLSKVRP